MMYFSGSFASIQTFFRPAKNRQSISNALTQQVIGELECFFVLHNAVAVRYDT